MLTPWDPLGYKTYHYRQARKYVMPNSQAAGPIWEFRWSSSLGLCFVTRVTVKAIQTGTVTAGSELRFDLTVARGFTLADPTNTVSILRATNNQKINTAYGASILGEFREANSATAAAGGTYTLDSDPIAIGSYSTVTNPTIDGGVDEMFNYQPYADGDQVLRFNKNEGFIINSQVAAQAANSFTLYLEVNWVEAIKP